MGLLLAPLSGISAPTWGDQGDGTFRNPILNADYADPDAIRVGDDFYLVASDCHYIGMQVLHSRDLVNWEIIGQVFHRLPINPRYDNMTGYGEGSWAPALRHHDGQFYLYVCTPTEGLFLWRAPAPAGPWSGPVTLKSGSNRRGHVETLNCEKDGCTKRQDRGSLLCREGPRTIGGMPRKLRIEFAGAIYHINNRGNYRLDVFIDDKSKDAFLQCLFQAAQRFGWKLHSFVVMRNHFHLTVELTEPNLSDGMKWLQGTWASRFNRFRGEAGHLFQGRFKARHVEPGASVLTVADYDHLNPVKAKIVSSERAADYRWSSLYWFKRKRRPGFLCAETILAECGNLPDSPAGWKQYQRHLEAVAKKDPKLGNKRFAQLKRGWVVGSPAFKESLRKKLSATDTTKERFLLLGTDRKAIREARALVWEEKLQGIAVALEINLERLPDQKSAPSKVWLAAMMKATTSVSNGWLARRLAMGGAGSVSVYVQRFRMKQGVETEAYRQMQLRVST
jgi:putative transposase